MLQNVTTVREDGKACMQEREGGGHRKDGQGQGLRDQGSLKNLHFFPPSRVMGTFGGFNRET